MTRWLTALLGALFLAGCPQNIPPEPPEPPGPIVVEQEPRPEENVSDGTEAQTRQRALRVMATEQRNVLNALEQQTRFTRISSRTSERLRAALAASEDELSSISSSIDALGRADLSFEDRHARQDALKDRLRRLASRLAQMEIFLREG